VLLWSVFFLPVSHPAQACAAARLHGFGGGHRDDVMPNCADHSTRSVSTRGGSAPDFRSDIRQTLTRKPSKKAREAQSHEIGLRNTRHIRHISPKKTRAST
jgi:hypothetical protein